MLSSLLVAIALFLQPSTAPTTQARSLSSAEAIQVIDRFFANPMLGQEAMEITKFAEESEECAVAVNEDVAPWASHQPPYAQRGVLLVAYIAGDVRAQLDAHKAEDNPYAGMLGVIKTYQKLQQADAKLSIPEIDDMVAMEKRGELKAHAEAIAKKRDK